MTIPAPGITIPAAGFAESAASRPAGGRAPAVSGSPDTTLIPKTRLAEDEGNPTAGRKSGLAEDSSKPAKASYDGPPTGSLLWNGTADKGADLVIDGGSASLGTLQGKLPGVPCMIRVQDPNVAVAEAPGPTNRFQKIVLRFNKKGKFSLRIDWEILR